MIPKSTHIFKQVDNLDLKVDIIYSSSLTSVSTAVLYLHGGGLTGFDRELLPSHIVQSCLLRNWPIISADYRLMPQASAQDMLDDKGADQGLESDLWKGFGKTIIVHGDRDEFLPHYMAKQAVDVIGPENAQLFTAIDKTHAWDYPLFLGDPELKVVEEAWKALDEIVFQAQAVPPV
ncbi:hypothetical protein EAF04_005248 [Stromatinia cepivora]|nr:hypothetical protein EAF04_005248 [Stromatinia cepivora]